MTGSIDIAAAFLASAGLSDVPEVAKQLAIQKYHAAKANHDRMRDSWSPYDGIVSDYTRSAAAQNVARDECLSLGIKIDAAY